MAEVNLNKVMEDTQEMEARVTGKKPVRPTRASEQTVGDREVASGNNVNEKKEKLEPIAKGTLKKETRWTKFKDSFVARDMKSVGRYVWDDILIPTIKSTISDVVSNGIDTMLYGEGGRRGSSVNRYKGNSSYVSYSRYSDARDPRDYNDRRDNRCDDRRGGIRTDYIVSTRQEADEIIDRLRELIEVYGMATVDDLKDLVGEPGDYTDRNWGWRNLRDAGCIRVRDGFELQFPRLQSLK